MADVRWLSLLRTIPGRLGWVAVALGACRAEPPARARVELGGGPNPGAYEAKAQTPSCARGPVGPGSWGVQLTDWTGPKQGLRSLQLLVPSAARPEEFYLGLVFGDLFVGTVHEIETRPIAPHQRGRGKVTVSAHDDRATVSVTGYTQDSVAVTATITCALAREAQGETR